MTLRKFLGILCIGINILGLLLELKELGFIAMLFSPATLLHILLFVTGGFWLSPDASRNKRMVTALASAFAAGYLLFHNLISLRAVTPMAILNFCYLPLTVLLFAVVIREGKDSAK